MSRIKINLKDEHIKLLQNLSLRIKVGSKSLNKSFVEDFDDDDLYDVYGDIDTILNGKIKPFNPDSFDVLKCEQDEYTEEQKAEWDKLLNELPAALDIILKLKTFETGLYTTVYNSVNWKKVNEIRIK